MPKQFKIQGATHLENLEKSGNSKVVREKSGKLKFAWTLNELKS